MQKQIYGEGIFTIVRDAKKQWFTWKLLLISISFPKFGTRDRRELFPEGLLDWQKMFENPRKGLERVDYWKITRYQRDPGIPVGFQILFLIGKAWRERSRGPLPSTYRLCNLNLMHFWCSLSYFASIYR